MSELHNFDEQLAAIEAEQKEIEAQRLLCFAEIGEKAIGELKDRPEYAELSARIDGFKERSIQLKEQEATLAVEKERAERERKERLAMYTCVNCKTENPEGAKFCEECGTPVGFLPREFCRACGTMNPAGLKFCGECGTKLNEIAAQA